MNIPKQDKIVVTYIFDGLVCYIATRNSAGKYVLYKALNKDYQKLKTSDTPIDFDDIIAKDRSN